MEDLAAAYLKDLNGALAELKDVREELRLAEAGKKAARNSEKAGGALRRALRFSNKTGERKQEGGK